MMLYKRYQSARDAAWRMLLQYKVNRLPVDVEEMARHIGVDIQSGPVFSGAAARSIRKKGKWCIQVQKNLPFSRYRFAVAHELGHLVLQHKTVRLEDGTFTFAGNQNAGDVLMDAQLDADTDADMFAIRLLAPACVLHELGYQDARRIGDACGLPPDAARMRAERMQLLNQRNVYFTHPLERQLQRQFAPYVRKENTRPVPPAPPSFELPPVLPERKEEAIKQEENGFSLPLWVWVAAAALALLALIFLR